MQKLPRLLSDQSSQAVPAVSERTVAFRTLTQDGLPPILGAILQELQREIGSYVDQTTGSAMPDPVTVEFLLRRASEKAGIQLSPFERDAVLEHLERSGKQFGILQELVDDPTVSDIIVTHYGRISVQQSRKNFATDLSFPSQDAYEAFVERLLLQAGTTCSTKKPIADGMIGSFARVHVVHKSLCESGPYLTIRLNRFSSVTTRDLLDAGLAPRVMLDYLQGVVRGGKTLLIVGEVGTGKTTLVRALASTIPGDESILVIEDTPEIRLEHPHVRYVTTREANSDDAGRISPSECIRGGMRMAMNRIIFGEIRDAEAAEAFVDVCASGHPGLSTIHARSALDALTRLELFLGRAQRGVSRAVIDDQIATAVHVVAFVNICGSTGRRRIFEVEEIGPVADGVIRHRTMFKYAPRNGIPSWIVHSRVSAHRDILESGSGGVFLSKVPSTLGLSDSELPNFSLGEEAA